MDLVKSLIVSNVKKIKVQYNVNTSKMLNTKFNTEASDNSLVNSSNSFIKLFHLEQKQNTKLLKEKFQSDTNLMNILSNDI